MPRDAEVSKLMHRLSFSCDYIVYFSNAFKEIVLIVLAALSMSYLLSCCFMVIDLSEESPGCMLFMTWDESHRDTTGLPKVLQDFIFGVFLQRFILGEFSWGVTGHLQFYELSELVFLQRLIQGEFRVYMQLRSGIFI